MAQSNSGVNKLLTISRNILSCTCLLSNVPGASFNLLLLVLLHLHTCVGHSGSKLRGICIFHIIDPVALKLLDLRHQGLDAAIAPWQPSSKVYLSLSMKGPDVIWLGNFSIILYIYMICIRLYKVDKDFNLSSQLTRWHKSMFHLQPPSELCSPFHHCHKLVFAKKKLSHDPMVSHRFQIAIHRSRIDIKLGHISVISHCMLIKWLV